MPITDKQIEHIEDYLSGQLSHEQKLAFEKQMSNDPELASEVEVYRGLVTSVRKQSRVELKGYLNELDKEGATYKMRHRWTYTLGIAASISLICITTYLIFFGESRSDKLYDQFYETYPNIVEAKTREEAETDLRQKAFYAYQDAEYEKARSLFQQLLADDPSSGEFNLYQGLTYLELNEPQQALKYFKKIINNTSSSYIDQAQWYASLAALKLNDKDMALTYTKSLSLKKGHYGSKAEALLKELEE